MWRPCSMSSSTSLKCPCKYLKKIDHRNTISRRLSILSFTIFESPSVCSRQIMKLVRLLLYYDIQNILIFNLNHSRLRQEFFKQLSPQRTAATSPRHVTSDRLLSVLIRTIMAVASYTAFCVNLLQSASF
jgi:hypothetical protein